MSRKEWVAVVAVIGLGIVWQIAGHDDAMTPDGEPHMYSPTETEREQTSAPADPAESAGPYRTVALEVTGMTCTGCATAARVVVERIEGVREATFSYPQGTGTVTFDSTTTSTSEIVTELTRATGFRATPRDMPGGNPLP